MKRRLFPLFIFVMLNRNGCLKSRGVSDGSFHRVCSDEMDCTSLAPDFCALNHVAAVETKEERDTAAVNLTEFFLQVEDSEDVERLEIKLTDVAALLLV